MKTSQKIKVPVKYYKDTLKDHKNWVRTHKKDIAKYKKQIDNNTEGSERLKKLNKQLRHHEKRLKDTLLSIEQMPLKFEPVKGLNIDLNAAMQYAKEQRLKHDDIYQCMSEVSTKFYFSPYDIEESHFEMVDAICLMAGFEHC